jgi:hypothetical protein
MRKNFKHDAVMQKALIRVMKNRLTFTNHILEKLREKLLRRKSSEAIR